MMSKEELIDFFNHHFPIIIKYEDGSWCNANIKFENNTVIVIPNSNVLFED